MTIWHMPLYKELWKSVKSGDAFAEYQRAEGNAAAMQCDFTRDVMATMTKVRKDWGMQYPGEEW